MNKKGDVKKTFISRFSQGVIAELDYSQLEVVCQGVNSMDHALLQALIDGVCFHCEWAAFMTGEAYSDVYQWAKVAADPTWVLNRQNAKPVGFGENYGAGVPALVEASGIQDELAPDGSLIRSAADIITDAINIRKKKYHRLYQFHEDVQKEVEGSRVQTRMRTEHKYQRCVGYYRSVTGTVYHFLENEAPKFKQDQGIMTAFSPTTIKNYPSQGLGGEIMQTMMGLVWRQLVKHRVRDKIKLVLTVHDSLYPDCINAEVAKEYLPKIASVLEMVCWYFNQCFPKVNWNTPFPVTAEYGQNIKEVGAKEGVSSDLRGMITERDYEWVNEIKASLSK